MIEIGLGHYLFLGAIIFFLGVMGIFLNRKNVIVILMSIELILLAVNINLISFSIFRWTLQGGTPWIYNFFRKRRKGHRVVIKSRPRHLIIIRQKHCTISLSKRIFGFIP